MIYSLNPNNEDKNYITYLRGAVVDEANIIKQRLTDAAATFIANYDLENDHIQDIMDALQLFDEAILDITQFGMSVDIIDNATRILSSLESELVDLMDPKYI